MRAGTGSVEAFVISKNLHRRHLTESQRAMVAAKMANMRRGYAESQRRDAPIGASPMSTAEAAEMLNVGRMSVHRAKVILRDGTPEEIKAVEQGTTNTIHFA